MKKYFMIFSMLAFVACTNAKKDEAIALEAAEKEEMMRQRTIDSMEIVTLQTNQQNVSAAASNNSVAKSEEPVAKKGMNNKTKGALIGAGAGIVAGAATGAAVSKDKGKGAVVGGVIGGAVGSGVGYGVGAKKDQKEGQ